MYAERWKETKQHVWQAILWCVCTLPILYFAFREKRNKTEVEMNAGAREPGFQNEKQNCTDKSEVKKGKGWRGSLRIYIGCF